MNSHGDGFIVRHRSGRYFSSCAHFEYVKRVDGTNSGCHDPSIPMAIIYSLVDSPFAADLVANRAWCGQFLQTEEWAGVADQFEVVPGPGCSCCGERWGEMQSDGATVHRCTKHLLRNPCAVEGCKRTTATKQGNYHNDAHLCGEHFRIAAPPGSPERRVYNRLWRLHRKRDGKDGRWSPDLDRRYWRVWFRLVALARARTAGDIDMDEINKLFGWEE